MAERQSARMSKITNDTLTRSGTWSFIAVFDITFLLVCRISQLFKPAFCHAFIKRILIDCTHMATVGAPLDIWSLLKRSSQSNCWLEQNTQSINQSLKRPSIDVYLRQRPPSPTPPPVAWVMPSCQINEPKNITELIWTAGIIKLCAIFLRESHTLGAGEGWSRIIMKAKIIVTLYIKNVTGALYTVNYNESTLSMSVSVNDAWNSVVVQ